MTPEQRADHEALCARIAAQVAYDRRLIRRCRALIEPLLSVAGFEARIVLYPRELLSLKRASKGNQDDRA